MSSVTKETNYKNKEFTKIYIIFAALVSTALLFYIEQILLVDYIVKAISKIILFITSQIILIKVIRKVGFKEGLNINFIDKKNIGTGTGLGIIAGAILIGAFFLLQEFIDLGLIFLELETKAKITAQNYLLVIIYFSFINSFLEESFFRGFIFLNLYKMGHKKFAYIFSAGLFSLYHIGIFRHWFTIEIFLLCLIGLFITGIVFDYIDTKQENFLNSWIIHIIADVAIAAIGYVYLF